MTGRSTNRRGLLAAAGAAFLAGCSELDPFSDGSRETISTFDLPDVTDDGEAEPTVVETVPVTIGDDLLADRARRTTDLLARLPLSFGAEEIPNGHVRRRLLDAADSASSQVDAARDADSSLAALESLRRARSEARYAAAGWAFAEGDVTEADLRAEHGSVLEAARDFEAEHAYVGSDPVEAAVLHARIERTLDRVLGDGGTPGRRGNGDLLPVAEWGEHAEEARGRLADGRYLYEQFGGESPETGTVEETLQAAADSLTAELEQRRGDLPPEPTEGDRDQAWRLRYRLRDDAEDASRDVADAPGPASAVLAAVDGLVDHLAYDRIRGRLDDGEQFAVAEAADVHEARSSAIEAVDGALAESPSQRLARPVLADVAFRIAATDEELARLQGDVHATRLDDPVRWYVSAAARARSVPVATRLALEALAA